MTGILGTWITYFIISIQFQLCWSISVLHIMYFFSLWIMSLLMVLENIWFRTYFPVIYVYEHKQKKQKRQHKQQQHNDITNNNIKNNKTTNTISTLTTTIIMTMKKTQYLRHSISPVEHTPWPGWRVRRGCSCNRSSRTSWTQIQHRLGILTFTYLS